MAYGCKVCGSAHKTEIESALLKIELATEKPKALQYVADSYGVSSNELKIHAVMHMSMPIDLGNRARASDEPNQADGVGPSSRNLDVDVDLPELLINPSLTHQMKLRESDMLLLSAQEYLMTLQNVGRRINRIANHNDSEIDNDFLFAKYITKPLVDLYVGTGRELRETLRAIADVNQIVNGPKENDGSGLTALANAIKFSAEALTGSADRDEPTPTAAEPSELLEPTNAAEKNFAADASSGASPVAT